MITSGFVLLALLASLLTSVVVGAALVTYVIRTWQQIRGGDDGRQDDLVLDGIDRLEIQIGALNRRLARLEQWALPPGEEPALPEAGETDPRGVSSPDSP